MCIHDAWVKGWKVAPHLPDNSRRVQTIVQHPLIQLCFIDKPESQAKTIIVLVKFGTLAVNIVKYKTEQSIGYIDSTM